MNKWFFQKEPMWAAPQKLLPQNLNDIQDSIIALESAGDDGTHPAYYIDLVGDYPNYTCPVAMADIKAAYEAEKVLKCRSAMGKYTATLPLFVPIPSANTWISSGSGALTAMGFPAQSLTIAIDNGTVQASNTQLASMDDIPTIPTALKNPNALTIKIGSTTVTYDGSAAKTVAFARFGCYWIDSHSIITVNEEIG